MTQPPPSLLLNYIAPGAPATRRPAAGDEAALRPEIGFSPRWYRQHAAIDFGERYHRDPACRREAQATMRAVLAERFPSHPIGCMGGSDAPLDVLTGLFGGNTVAAIYGVPIVYAEDNWPATEHAYLDDDAADALTPPDLDTNPVFSEIMRQVDWIAENEGRAIGFINWQGVLNNAQRLRGQAIFTDMIDRPERARRLFECVAATMADGCERLQARQRETGFDVRFFTVSNCLVNMISPNAYRDFFLELDQRFAERFGCLGVHNCAWNADPSMADYATLPHLAYIDMGLQSNLTRAKALCPHARRALMYTPMDLANKPMEQVREDVTRIAREIAPCDLVVGDIDADVPDDRVHALLDHCAALSECAT